MTVQTDSIRNIRAPRRAKPIATATTDSRKAKPSPAAGGWRQPLFRLLPAWILLAMVLSILLPNIMAVTFGTVGQSVSGATTAIVGTITGSGMVSSSIAPLFTPEVQRWGADITRWAVAYNVDPNLLATVMQIESCGHSTVSSTAGAQGLFQVMPFHFATGEVQTDPETNARRSANFLNECLGYANGDPGLALACYNGGPSVTVRPYSAWADETQRYYNWATGIYSDAHNNLSSSPTLANWLAAGGSNLCSLAASTPRPH